MERRETPVNTRESSVGLVERPLGDRVRGIHIPAQPPGHMGVAKIVRERALESTRGAKAADVLQRFDETPEDKSFSFLSRVFHKKLEQYGVLKRKREDSKEMQALREQVRQIKKKERVSQKEQLLLFLWVNRGRFISRDRLTRVIEGDRWDLDKLDLENSDDEDYGMGAVDIAVEKFRLKKHLNNKTEDLMLGDSIFSVHSVGMGVGIESFGLNHQEVWLLHYYYSHPGESIPDIRIAPYLPHRKDEVVDLMNSLSVVRSRLNAKARKFGYLFQLERDESGNHRLIDKVVEKKLLEKFHSTPESEKYACFDKAFQDWLEQTHVLQRESLDSKGMQILKNMVREIRNKGEDRNRYEIIWSRYEKLLYILMSEAGYFISQERLNTVLRSQHIKKECTTQASVLKKAKYRLQEELRKRLGNLMMDDVFFRNSRFIGVGIGIQDFGLDFQEMFFLHKLYSSPPDTWVSKHELLSGLPDRRMDTTDPFGILPVCIATINAKARRFGYLFEIQTAKGLGYKLVMKQETAA